jgi:translation initiation factor 4E
MASAAVKGGGSNPLHTPFTFSFMRRGGGGGSKGKNEEAADSAAAAAAAATGTASGTATTGATASSGMTTTSGNVVHPYENSIKTITTVSTVESFWEVYDYLKRPGEMPSTTDYHFFRQGIKPTWEDPSNAKGGKWIVRLPKGLANRYWEETILALIGAQFTGVAPDEVCGAVLSVRYNEDILGIWNRNAHDSACIERIRDSFKKILHLPPHAHLEYKPHQNSIQDRSSFRNTTVWKPKSFMGEDRRASTMSSVPAPSSAAGPSSSSAAVPPAEVQQRRSGSWAEAAGSATANKPKRDSAPRGGWR